MLAARHGGLTPALATLLALGAGCTPQDQVESPQQTITLAILKDARIQGPIRDRIMGFQRKTGINVNVHTVDRLKEIYAASQSPNHGIDVVIALNVWVGDFVNSGFIQPLDSYIGDMRDPELAWDDISPGVINKNRWGGRVYSMICDNDNMFLTYRKDVLANPVWRDMFLAEKQYPLPNPPTTMDELADVAAFFDGKDWDGTGSKKRGFAVDTSTDGLMQWYALAMTTPYTVVERRNDLPNGIFLFRPLDMTPLVNTPGFKAGVARWLDLARRSNATNRQDVINQMIKGQALMAIDWGDTGPAALDPASVVKGKLGFALTPGTRKYYDWAATPPGWVDAPAVHLAPLNAANGFAFYMTSTSEHKGAVWKFIKYMNSPDISMGIVSDVRGGYQPWRTSHTTVDRWVEAGWDRDSAKNYVDTILASTNHPNASLDVRIPGIFDYGGALQTHLLDLLNAATPDIDAEMDACAADMQVVTRNNLVDAQIAAYARHLGQSE